MRALSRGTIRDLNATRVDPRRRVAIPLTNVAGVTMGPFKPASADDSWEGRLRVQRDCWLACWTDQLNRKPILPS